MFEVLAEAVALVNLPFTVLLGLVVLYWSLVALGALDTSFGSDVDAHVETEAHLEGHGAAHHESETDGHDGGWFSDVLHFINVGAVPLMVVLSVLSLSLWIGSMIANHYWTGGDPLLALAFILPNILVSAIVTRYVTLPLKPLFRLLRRDGEAHLSVVGQFCRIMTSQATGTFGQAEVTTKGAPLLIEVRTMDGLPLARGASAVVVREDNERGIYFVAEVPRPQLSS